MARRPHSSKLENRTNRLKLPVQKKPHAFVTIAPGIALGYRRNQGAGTWVVRAADGKGGNWTKAFAIADDHEEANGLGVLTFWQAQDKAKALARGTVETGRPVTVLEAIDAYAAHLAARGGLAGNVSRVRHHLPAALAAKPVALLTARELEHWRNSLAVKPATINRIAHVFKAALNHSQRLDPTRITNAHAWKIGLALLPHTHRPRNVILPDAQVRALIAAANADDPAFGLYVETAATTGARPCQLVQLEVADLQADRKDPRLMMPSSRKGHAGKRVVRKPVPIPTNLAARLRQAAGGRDGSAPLLLRADGKAWSATSADHRIPFASAVARVGLKPSKVTFYSLRHSAIVRQILAGTPLRVIADAADTSTGMIERTYSAHISGHADALLRNGLLDATQQQAADNIVPLSSGRRP